MKSVVLTIAELLSTEAPDLMGKPLTVERAERLTDAALNYAGRNGLTFHGFLGGLHVEYAIFSKETAREEERA